MRIKERLLRPHINVTGAILILLNRTDGSACRDARYLLPRRAGVAGNEDAGKRRADPDALRILRAGGDAKRARIECS